MADTELLSALNIARGDKIAVTVESVLPDIIVVTFAHGVRSFQGALLDINKRGLPCGINPPEPITDPDGDKLVTLAARFTYFQEKKFIPVANKVDLRRNINPPARYRNARPTVRLRPRQVLCNKCRSICNEKNENVDVGKKRRHDEPHAIEQENTDDGTPPVTSTIRRSERRCAQPQGQVEKSQVKSTLDRIPSLIPKISRLECTEIKSDNKDQLGQSIRLSWFRQTTTDESSWNSAKNHHPDAAVVPSESSESSEENTNANVACHATPRRLSSSSVESAKMPEDDEKMALAAADSTMKTRAGGGRVSRKKRSIGSMEDLWDETIFEDMARSTSQSTPVIKISFGTQGGGTVVKIPSKMKKSTNETYVNTEETDPLELDNLEKQPEIERVMEINKEDDSEQQDPLKLNGSGKDLACAKAAKRALKKAKKEARRKMLVGGVSPARSPLNSSPRYNPTYDPLLYHRRKHKVKHKKKHKEERKQHKTQQYVEEPENKVTSVNLVTTINEKEIHRSDCNIFPAGESYTAIKEQCLKQKLSISLKRLNTNAYARCDYPVSNASSGCKSPGASSEELSETEPEQQIEHEADASDNITDFSPPNHPLAIRFASTTVEHCLTATGRRMDVGDIVWGKIHGFPWWPGKVLSISISCKEDGTSDGAQAHVAWYGSSTCSLMPCDRLSPFLETFKARYNKKKRGPYKEAIRQAQSEARSQMSNSPNDILKVCESSPREVNVVS